MTYFVSDVSQNLNSINKSKFNVIVILPVLYNLYVCQGTHLAERNVSLCDDELEFRYVVGPVQVI